MKKVLFVTYYFPPIVSVASIRSTKFAKYLPLFGWEPIVLTVKNRNPIYTILDYSFLRVYSEKIKVYRNFHIPLAIVSAALRKLGINDKLFLIPDHYVGWLPFAVFSGVKIIKNEKVDLIFATAPPYSSLIIGLILKKLTHKPLIVDYRDLWINNPFITYPTNKHLQLERSMEEFILKNSDSIIVSCESQKKTLLKEFSFLSSNDVYVIYNGFDAEDLNDVKKIKFSKFTIIHAGSIYGPRITDFKIFVDALNDLVLNGDISPEDTQLILIGHLSRSFINYLRNFRFVNYLGLKSYKESLGLMSSSHILLLIPGVHGRNRAFVPAKFFDYMLVKRFILNLDYPETELSHLITKFNCGVSVPPYKSHIKRTLLKILSGEMDIRVSTSIRRIKQFNRKELTKQLAELMNVLTR